MIQQPVSQLGLDLNDFASRTFSGLELGTYNVLEADPAWKYVMRSEAGEGRSPDQHYDCMSIDDIKRLPVGALAAPDCWLFLWTTWPHLPQALDVIKAWGFKYSSNGFLWAKLRRGATGEEIAAAQASWHLSMGYTTRKGTEPCLLARRGSPKRLSKSVRELIVAPVREHSRKPDEAYQRICEFAAGPRAALFTREQREGFDCWGNEAGKFDGDGDE